MELLTYVLERPETGLLAFIGGFSLAVIVGALLTQAVKS